jgi:hypothetical protein
MFSSGNGRPQSNAGYSISMHLTTTMDCAAGAFHGCFFIYSDQLLRRARSIVSVSRRKASKRARIAEPDNSGTVPSLSVFEMPKDPATRRME